MFTLDYFACAYGGGLTLQYSKHVRECVVTSRHGVETKIFLTQLLIHPLPVHRRYRKQKKKKKFENASADLFFCKSVAGRRKSWAKQFQNETQIKV